MSDVRLTATNPEDSSVVPVACNSKGELLVTEQVIEQIDNDVTINGIPTINIEREDGNGTATWTFKSSGGSMHVYQDDPDNSGWRCQPDGYTSHKTFVEDVPHVLNLCHKSFAMRALVDGATVYRIEWSGAVTAPNMFIQTEPDKAEHYSSVRDLETDQEIKEYIGPVLNVREELAFLRAQIQLVMERLKMAPEQGWPVWDGSDED